MRICFLDSVKLNDLQNLNTMGTNFEHGMQMEFCRRRAVQKLSAITIIYLTVETKTFCTQLHAFRSFYPTAEGV
jgi:hypothetical protein